MYSKMSYLRPRMVYNNNNRLNSEVKFSHQCSVSYPGSLPCKTPDSVPGFEAKLQDHLRHARGSDYPCRIQL